MPERRTDASLLGERAHLRLAVQSLLLVLCMEYVCVADTQTMDSWAVSASQRARMNAERSLAETRLRLWREATTCAV